MSNLFQNEKSQKRLAHEKIQAYRERIRELKKSKCITDMFPEDGNSNDTLFVWDELSDKENVKEIKECFEKCISIAKEFMIDLDVIYEYADLLRFNWEYTAALELFKTLETYYLMNGASDWDYFSLYERMAICCEKNYEETTSALPYCRKVLEFSLKLEKNESDKTLSIASISKCLFRLADLDWREKCLGEDLRLFQQTLDLIKRMSEENKTVCYEVEAIATGYIVICEIMQNGTENVQILQKASELFQNILEERSHFKWPLEISVCCDRLAATLKTCNATKMAVSFCDMEYRILKHLADSNFAQYGPEYFLVCENLASMLSDDIVKALWLYRKALDIRLRLEKEGIQTFMKRETVSSFILSTLPPLKQSFDNLALLLLENGYMQEALECLEDFEANYF